MTLFFMIVIDGVVRTMSLMAFFATFQYFNAFLLIVDELIGAHIYCSRLVGSVLLALMHRWWITTDMFYRWESLGGLILKKLIQNGKNLRI